MGLISSGGLEVVDVRLVDGPDEFQHASVDELTSWMTDWMFYHIEDNGKVSHLSEKFRGLNQEL